MNLKIGSMWRKWDLHIHTPYSVLNTGDFGNGYHVSTNDSIMNKYIYNLFNKAISEEIYAIGITDYFTIAGYEKVKEILSDDDRLRNIFSYELSTDKDYLKKIKSILLLPNIELRLDIPIVERRNGGNSNSKYQIHVIFSDCIKAQEIKQNFIHRLNFLETSGTTSTSKKPLTIENIENYGRDLKQRNIGGNGTDLFVGMNNVSVSFKDIVDILDEEQFKKKAIIVLSEEDQSKINWLDQAAGLRKNMYSGSHAIFSSNPNTVDWARGDDCKTMVDKFLPCIWGSDARCYDEMFKPNLDRYTWIKADVTFEGLQIALRNFNNRLIIGEEPVELQLIKERASFTIKKVISGLKNKIEKSKVWFDINLNLNPLMVTIIGNKGSGKSALSDIIAYLGNSYNSVSFSFLSKNRFLDKKANYGKLYTSELIFNNDEIIKKNDLAQVHNQESVEYVKYLPQKFIEEVVNDLGYQFQEEINNTIYSYIAVEDKGDSNNLIELITNKTKANYTNLSNIRTELEKLNSEIFALEEKGTAVYRTEIKAKLINQEKKLQNHIANKPKEVKQISPEKKTKSSEIITKLSGRVSKIDDIIAELTKELTIINANIQYIEDFLSSVGRYEKYTDEVNKEYLVLSSRLGLQINNYITVKYNSQNLINKKDEFLNRKIQIDQLLDISDNIFDFVPYFDIKDYDVKLNEILNIQKSFFVQKEILNRLISELSKGVSIEEQKYLSYLSELKEWNEKKKMYEGEIPNNIDGESVKKYADELDYIDNKLNQELDSLKSERLELINSIFDEYKIIIDKYQDIYRPIQQKINAMLNSNNEKIEFSAQIFINESEVKGKIGNYIDYRADSDFRGSSGGNRQIEDIISSTDFNFKTSVIGFVNEFLNKTTQNPNDIKKILTKPKEFYDYLTKLDFLKPEYTILSNGKKMNELSPGERGIILLIFYLALSKDNIPIIIDQPEDNLDNQSVFNRLVPAILESKKSRQVIIVTHNPNIAIACDSEQVIYCNVNTDSGELKYLSGSIENPMIMEKIVDVLEGTKPAFDKRKFTYEKNI